MDTDTLDTLKQTSTLLENIFCHIVSRVLRGTLPLTVVQGNRGVRQLVCKIMQTAEVPTLVNSVHSHLLCLHLSATCNISEAFLTSRWVS